LLFRTRDHRGLDGDRLPEAIDDAPARGPKQSGGWRRSDFLASRGMGEAQGKKVDPTPLRLRRSRQPSYG
jgi:hypothetical protein